MAAAKKRRTQAERTEASDKAMFKAAIALIAKEGPSKMTLASVGKKAGFSGGLVSYRFGSKSNLLKATADRILELWQSRVVDPALSEELEDDATAQIKTVSRLYLEAVAAKSDLIMAQFRLMNDSYSTYKELQPTFQEYDRAVRNNLVERIQAFQDKGSIRKDIDVESIVISLVGTLRGVAVQYFIDSESVDLKKVYKTMEDLTDSLLAG
ncbi:hypothetical protein R50073_31220 [Maricurvus nonylphenolicus]|uniref:TetR/AcrR family transcriptional regulator n=1 Tax=Maricurvus nonylphenolicus TaxID=1008307 RepID=UPI0036F28927